jgi:preprotein translocase subunit SecE
MLRDTFAALTVVFAATVVLYGVVAAVDQVTKKVKSK